MNKDTVRKVEDKSVERTISTTEGIDSKGNKYLGCTVTLTYKPHPIPLEDFPIRKIKKPHHIKKKKGYER